MTKPVLEKTENEIKAKSWIYTEEDPQTAVEAALKDLGAGCFQGGYKFVPFEQYVKTFTSLIKEFQKRSLNTKV